MMNSEVQSLPSRAMTWLGGRRIRSVIVAGAAAVAVLTFPASASAQGWLKDRRYTEGEGIKAGDLELHPGIGGEVGYDSNWFLRSNNTGPTILNGAPTLPPRDAGVLRLTPSFYVSTASLQRLDAGSGRVEPRTIAFRGGVSATGRYLIGKEMSDQANISVSSDARLDINQNRPIGFGVFAGYNRIYQPQVLADPNFAFTHDDVVGGLEVIGMPGGGTLDIRGGYQLTASLFEESNGVPYSNITHELTVKDRWRFRPRTALFSDTSLRFITYPNAARASNYLNDSTPLRTRFGITGLITDSFGALAAAGYGATFFKDPAAASSTQYDSINGQVEGTYYLGRGGANDEPGQATLLLSTVSLGFLRDFQNSLLANFYITDKLYGRLEYWYGGRVTARFEVYGERLDFPPAFINPNLGSAPVAATSSFTNYRLGGSIFAEYRFSSAFGLNTTIDYVQQFSSTLLPAGALPGTVTQGFFDQNYNRIQAFLGFRYFY
jgi:hypothetical protein